MAVGSLRSSQRLQEFMLVHTAYRRNELDEIEKTDAMGLLT